MNATNKQRCFFGTLFIAISFVFCGELTASHFTQEQMDTITNQIKTPENLGNLTAKHFDRVITKLHANDFDGARVALTERIDVLKQFIEKNILYKDKEPGIVDCLTLDCLLSLYLNDRKQFDADIDYMTQVIKFPGAQDLGQKLPLIKRDGMGEFIKNAAKSMKKMYENAGAQRAPSKTT